MIPRSRCVVQSLYHSMNLQVDALVQVLIAGRWLHVHEAQSHRSNNYCFVLGYHGSKGKQAAPSSFSADRHEIAKLNQNHETSRTIGQRQTQSWYYGTWMQPVLWASTRVVYFNAKTFSCFKVSAKFWSAVNSTVLVTWQPND